MIALRARYREKLATAYPEIRLGEVTMFGSEMLILGRRTIVNRIRNYPLVKNNSASYRPLQPAASSALTGNGSVAPPGRLPPVPGEMGEMNK